VLNDPDLLKSLAAAPKPNEDSEQTPVKEND